LKTRLVEPVTGKPLFVNKYLTFKDPVEVKPTKPVEETEDNYIPSYDIPDNDFFEAQNEMRELQQAMKDGAVKKMGTPSVKKEITNMSTPFSTESTEEVIREPKQSQEPSENLSAFGITAQSEKDFLNDLVGGDEVTSDKTNDKNKVSTMTKEDAVNRVKELLQEGTIDKKCN
jgi:hypothetical protein